MDLKNINIINDDHLLKLMPRTSYLYLVSSKHIYADSVIVLLLQEKKRLRKVVLLLKIRQLVRVRSNS